MRQALGQGARVAALTALGLALAGQGCTVGAGWGLIEGCINLPTCGLDPGGDPFEACTPDARDFRFRPDFFAAEILGDGSLSIRAQKGGYTVGESDGILITVPDHSWVAERLVQDPANVLDSEKLDVLPISDLGTVELPRRFKVSTYWNSSCPSTQVAFTEGTGKIWFYSMYQSRDLGDPVNQPRIHLGFDLVFVDPWPYEEPRPDSARLAVTGELRFNYTRGSPAQPFP